MPKPKKKLPPTKKNPNKQMGFFANLPVSTIEKIRARTTPECPQWKVISDAINATQPKKAKAAGKKK